MTVLCVIVSGIAKETHSVANYSVNKFSILHKKRKKEDRRTNFWYYSSNVFDFES